MERALGVALKMAKRWSSFILLVVVVAAAALMIDVDCELYFGFKAGIIMDDLIMFVCCLFFLFDAMLRTRYTKIITYVRATACYSLSLFYIMCTHGH